MIIRVGTRDSRLALEQAHIVIKKLQIHFPNIVFEIIKIRTTGDILHYLPLTQIGGKALFLKEIEEALLNNDIDIAVHSMKDVPSLLPNGLIIDSILAREEPRDALVSVEYNSLDELPTGALVGTCSSRRKALLLSKRPDLNIVEIRGNIDTRIKKLKTKQIDAIILAAAGLKRLNLLFEIKHIFSIEEFLPAIAQGAIGIERRTDDKKIAAMITTVNDYETSICIRAERAFLEKIGGDCQTPVAAYASIIDNTIKLTALFATPDGRNIFSSTQIRPLQEPEILGNLVALDIINQKNNFNT